MRLGVSGALAPLPFSLFRAFFIAHCCTQVADHAAAVVGELKASLVRATKAFKVVVQQRTANVKAQQERKKE